MPRARVTFADGRTATITGTEDEIRGAIDSYNSQLDQSPEPEPQIQAGDEPLGPADEIQQDEAGNTVSRVELSENQQAQIQRLQQLAQADPSQAQSAQTQIQAIKDRATGKQPTFMDMVAGTADVAGALASAAWREPVSGFMGLYRFAATEGSFRDRLDAASGQIRDFQAQGAQIDSEKAQEVLATVTKPLQWYDEGAQWVATQGGGIVGAIAGEEAGIATSAALYTAALMAPEAIGLKGAAARRAANAAVDETTRSARSGAQQFQRGGPQFDRAGNLVARREGSLELSPAAWQGRVHQRARSMGGEAGRGRNMQGAVDELQSQRRAAEQQMKQAWADAENAGQLRYYTANMESWSQGIERAMVDEGYDFRNMPRARQFLEDVRTVSTQNPLNQAERAITAQHGLPQSLANINELEALNKRLNRALRSVDGEEFAALSRIKQEFNTTIDSQIDRGLMSGDPAVRTAFSNAREVSRAYYSRFNDDKVISRLAHMEADAEQFRNWLFGASDALPPASINSVLDRIADMPNGQQMLDGVKAETMRGLLQPLLKSEPSYQNFIDGVDRFKERYPSLFDRMDFNLGELEQLRRHVTVLNRHGGSGMLAGLDPSSLVARFWVGHGIARQGAKVNLLARGIKALVGTVFGNASRRMWDDLLHDATDGAVRARQPLFPMTNAGVMMAVTADGLQNMGVEPEAAKPISEEAVRGVPQLQANMADHNEAAQAKDETPRTNRNYPDEEYDVIADATAFANGQGSPRSIGSELMVQENDRALTDWDTYGARVHPDVVLGKAAPTIGFGTNILETPTEDFTSLGLDKMALLEGRQGITQEQGIRLMQKALVRNELELRRRAGTWYNEAPNHVRRAIRNLAYNMGVDGVLSYGTRFNAALRNGKWGEAAKELLTGKTPGTRSAYVNQVQEGRARRVAATLAGVAQSQIKIPPPNATQR